MQRSTEIPIGAFATAVTGTFAVALHLSVVCSIGEPPATEGGVP